MSAIFWTRVKVSVAWTSNARAALTTSSRGDLILAWRADSEKNSREVNMVSNTARAISLRLGFVGGK